MELGESLLDEEERRKQKKKKKSQVELKRVSAFQVRKRMKELHEKRDGAEKESRGEKVGTEVRRGKELPSFSPSLGNHSSTSPFSPFHGREDDVSVSFMIQVTYSSLSISLSSLKQPFYIHLHEFGSREKLQPESFPLSVLHLPFLTQESSAFPPFSHSRFRFTAPYTCDEQA